ncbi:FMN-binding protein [Flavobacteriaceae bacterium]|nr:FMN-binding protein [Flavobacteriaceae bacterium]
MTKTFAIIFFGLGMWLPQEFSKRAVQKMNKEISSFFETSTFQLESDNQALHLATSNFMVNYEWNKITSAGKLLGYVLLAEAPSKTDTFEYLLFFDTNLQMTQAKVLTYREDYGSEIGNKRWLAQFLKPEKELPLAVGQNISAISGATISVYSMTQSINYFLTHLENIKPTLLQ